MVGISMLCIMSAPPARHGPPRGSRSGGCASYWRLLLLLSLFETLDREDLEIQRTTVTSVLLRSGDEISKSIGLNE